MRDRLCEVLALGSAAVLITGLLAAPVLRAPSVRVFGAEIVGRHHDPFTVMRQFEGPLRLGVYSQPATDLPGALLARVSNGVAAYNGIVLLTFPLSAITAYLLARQLRLSVVGAAVAALAYAFSPFHLAHAAYHPHIAQTQWLPLYLLALWRCLHDATRTRVGILVIATVLVTLSNFYAGMMCAVLTPVAMGAYAWALGRYEPGARARLVTTGATLLCVASAGLAYALYAAGDLFAHRTAYAYPYADLYRYSATGWSYLLPPVLHPLLGDSARRLWTGMGVKEGLLEQQMSLSAGLLALAFIAIGAWASRVRTSAALAIVPVLMLLAVTALVCSLPPHVALGNVALPMPSTLLYALLPMFRSYARFGLAVQLMVVLLGGVGLDVLRAAAARGARICGALLVALVAFEYAATPSALSRDVLPTPAHRWAVQQRAPIRALDCTPLTQESDSLSWLTGGRVTPGMPGSDCTEPNLPQTLAAAGYTHLIVRRDTPDGRWMMARRDSSGLRRAIAFRTAQVFALTAPDQGIYTAAMTGLFPREHNAEWSWRWMGAEAAWTVVNARQPTWVDLDLEMQAFDRARDVELQIDGTPLQTLTVQTVRRTYRVGPLPLSPGSHELVFRTMARPSVAGGIGQRPDPRALSLALGMWSWHLHEGDHR